MSFCFNNLFTNNAVFPHLKPIKVYGEGEGTVIVTFNGQSIETKAKSGKWLVTFPEMRCGGPYKLEARCGDETLALDGIYVGEVIFICGQSNMQFKLHETNDDPSRFVSDEKLRLYTIDRIEDTEYFHEKDGWVKCESETAGYWSALGYYIANEVSRLKGCAVGLIACYQGASMIQSWLPESVAESEKLFVPVAQRHSDYKDFSLWNGDGVLYEAMLKKVLPYSVNRVVFYQGESNTTEAEGAVYDRLLVAFVDSLRKGFDDSLLPVTVVQIADLDSKKNDEGWLAVQKAQLNVPNLTLNVKTVISADISESNNIHPPTKKPLALRIVDSFND